jgi:Terminase DNA packaging enzyme
MSKMFDNLNQVFNVSGDIVPAEKPSVVVPKEIEKTEVDSDYEYTRTQLYSLIEKGQDAIDGILDIAQASDHPRTYEVAGQLIKNVADITDKLLDLQKKMKELNQEVKTGPTTVNNALFVGSTAELQKLLKQGFKADE